MSFKTENAKLCSFRLGHSSAGRAGLRTNSRRPRRAIRHRVRAQVSNIVDAADQHHQSSRTRERSKMHLSVRGARHVTHISFSHPHLSNASWQHLTHVLSAQSLRPPGAAHALSARARTCSRQAAARVIFVLEAPSGRPPTTSECPWPKRMCTRVRGASREPTELVTAALRPAARVVAARLSAPAAAKPS